MSERLTDEYVASLEQRIAEQRKELQRLHAHDNNGGELKARANHKARLRIAKLERIIGVQAVKLQEHYYAIQTLHAAQPSPRDEGKPTEGER